MSYRIVSAVYGWEHLQKGFLSSIRANTNAEVTLVEASEVFGQKLKHQIWAREAKKGGNVVLMDVDTIVLKDIGEVFDYDFDIGITVRSGKNWFNGGVVFVKPTQAAYDILDLWAKKIHSKDQAKYKWETGHSGTAQPVFAWLYKHGKFNGTIREFPCSTYNCIQPWGNYRDASVIHVKSGLRKSLFSGKGHGDILNLIRPYYEGS